MIFKPVLVDKIQRDHKRITRRRLTALRYQAGREYVLQPGRGKPHVGHICVVSVHKEPLFSMTRADAGREGFYTFTGDGDLEAFREYWRALYGRIDLDEIVAVIEFRYTGQRECCAPFKYPKQGALL